MLLPPVKKRKTLACIREIQVHKFWTKVYSQKGLTAMSMIYIYVIYASLSKLSEKSTVNGEPLYTACWVQCNKN